MKKGVVKRSINASIKDGVCWANMVGFVEPYIVPFALQLGSSNFLIGMIRSIPSLLSSIAQFLSEYLVKKYNSCKTIVFWSVFIQATAVFLSSFLILLSDLWYSKYIFLILIIIYSFSGSTATAPWFTLMGEYLPADKRGIFFGRRTQIIGVFYFISSFLAGYLLKIYPDKTDKILLIIFFLASFFRYCSSYYIKMMYEPEKKFFIPKSDISFKTLEKDETFNFMKKVYISVFILLFSVYIAAPYFSVYVLKELKFDYIKYMFVVSFGQVITWVGAVYWGKMVDKIGSIKTIRYAFISIPMISFLWMVTKNFYFLLSVEIFSGFVWGAFGMVYNTLIYEYVKPSDRTKYTAYLIFTMSTAQFLGSFIGGILYDKIKIDNFSTFLILLGVSTLGRLLAFLYFNKKVYGKYSR